MLTNKIFNASALYDISLGCIMLAIKCSFAYYQIYFCLLSNTALLAIKYFFIIKKTGKTHNKVWQNDMFYIMV